MNMDTRPMNMDTRPKTLADIHRMLDATSELVGMMGRVMADKENPDMLREIAREGAVANLTVAIHLLKTLEKT